MTYFTASFSTIILRYYLMMGIVIGSFFSGFPVLAILALPVFLSALIGISFTSKPALQNATMNVVHTQKETKTTAA